MVRNKDNLVDFLFSCALALILSKAFFLLLSVFNSFVMELSPNKSFLILVIPTVLYFVDLVLMFLAFFAVYVCIRFLTPRIPKRIIWLGLVVAVLLSASMLSEEIMGSVGTNKTLTEIIKSASLIALAYILGLTMNKYRKYIT